MSAKDANLYGSGLNRRDWHRLRDAVLCAVGHGPDAEAEYNRLPARLRGHPVGVSVRRYLDGHPRAIEDAAERLAPGCENKWLVLDKS